MEKQTRHLRSITKCPDRNERACFLFRTGLAGIAFPQTSRF